MNGGRNYNGGPKVAKIPCRVSSDLHEWHVMAELYSANSVKLNRCESTVYPRQDGKTP